MAARQDQTLQIGLIISAILIVILGGCLVWVNKLKSDAQSQVVALKKSASDESNKARNLQTENESYRQFMGFEQFDSADEVQKQYEADMGRFGETFGDKDRAYRPILEAIFEENRRSAKLESESKQREKELKSQILAIEAEREAQYKKLQDTLATVEADLASERRKFDESRADLEKKRGELAKALERQRAEEDKRVAGLKKEMAETETQLTTVEKARDRLIENRKTENPSFEIADGSVTWVNQSNMTAWINLGELDDLRRQVTFSVYEQEAADAGKAEKKGSLEVIRLLGDHMAEARITNDDPRNPILPGDWIYSQVWHRGKPIHFAMTGIMDIDDDGDNDLQQAKDLIAINGGVLDATLEDDGQVTGELTVETRYLVLGDFPASALKSDLRKGWETMTKNARDLGIETITLQEFLNQMGYRPLDRTVKLGKGARASDFSGKPDGFRRRVPYSTP